MGKDLSYLCLKVWLMAVLSLSAGPVSYAVDRQAPENDEFDVFLLIGQSNMAGRGWLFPDDTAVMEGVFILNDMDEVVPATEPLNRFSSVRKRLSLQKMNIGGSFGRSIHEHTGRKVLLVVNARSGTSARLWRPGAPGITAKEGDDDLLMDGQKFPPLYDEAVRRTRKACRYGQLKAILFHQGEADAYPEYAPQWPGKVADIAESLRKDLGVDVPFIVGEVSYHIPNSAVINPYIRDISYVVPDSGWVSAEGCNANRDSIHFSRQGVTLLGERYAEKVLEMVYGQDIYAEEDDTTVTAPEGMYVISDFDRTVVDFDGEKTYCVTLNPVKDAVNTSGICGKAISSRRGAAAVSCSLTRPVDFTRSTEIRLKVISPDAGEKVFLSLSPSRPRPQAAPVTLSCETSSDKAWEELVFDCSEVAETGCNYYQRLTVTFGSGSGKRQDWYFDDLMIPDDDLSGLSLFRRTAAPMLPDPSVPWMSNSIANPDFLTPEESPDGNWWLFVRGGDGSRSHLGIYTQDTADFNPAGPWTYYEGNPVIPAGWYGEEDWQQAIDQCPVMGDDGRLYLFYKGISRDRKNTVLVAVSDDGLAYTRQDSPWKEDCGVADVVKSEGKYYLYVSRRVYVSDNPLDGRDAEMYWTLEKGTGPSNCDWYSINGQKIFRVSGSDKWFMAYQCGTCNPDFPDRFHIAVSDDLIHWDKVDNGRPFFTRGARGEWDQGAIWAPAIFEYDGNLYLYYEGWGREGHVPDRDRKYFRPGHSQIGIAVCPVDEFLEWCGLDMEPGKR